MSILKFSSDFCKVKIVETDDMQYKVETSAPGGVEIISNDFYFQKFRGDELIALKEVEKTNHALHEIVQKTIEVETPNVISNIGVGNIKIKTKAWEISFYNSFKDSVRDVIMIQYSALDGKLIYFSFSVS